MMVFIIKSMNFLVIQVGLSNDINL
ncbi:hypothetical protein, partial [uncultured Gammaproteobacteria bacterium]